VRTKTEIYCQILRYGLLSIRSYCDRHDIVFLLSDLLHNIPDHILMTDTYDMDEFFLNIEVRSYISACERLNRRPNAEIIALAQELYNLLREDWQSKITLPI
jgi:hypothetical protein